MKVYGLGKNATMDSSNSGKARAKVSDCLGSGGS